MMCRKCLLTVQQLFISGFLMSTSLSQEPACKNEVASSCMHALINEPFEKDSVSMLQTSVKVSQLNTPLASAEDLDSSLPGTAKVLGSNSFGDKECAPQKLQSTSLDDLTKRILIATPLKNAANLLETFVASLAKLSYPKSLLSVGFLVSDSEDDTAAMAAELGTRLLTEFADVGIFIKNYGYETPMDRHAFEDQGARRATLAKSRNALVKHFLTPDIDAVLWLDADIHGMPDTLVQDLLAIGRPVVAPHVLNGQSNLTYDKNSWRRVQHTSPEFQPLSNNDSVIFFEAYQGHEEGGRRDHMDDLRDQAQAQGIHDWRYAVKLDGVGTAVLLVDAKLYREDGLLFPETPYKNRLESEGFGLLAEDKGFPACGLPLYMVRHRSETAEMSLQEDFEPGNSTRKTLNLTKKMHESMKSHKKHLGNDFNFTIQSKKDHVSSSHSSHKSRHRKGKDEEEEAENEKGKEEPQRSACTRAQVGLVLLSALVILILHS
eukprot:gnl/MRDRNA2_/MRDRNA2_94743_c1_seq1.p1 gnl/MRDRNA2_/MRDRNA2_94743_c1~~gnl/MRDRNA2_/MRDRNA2_94743_c1_seq1.p1  ORF type:complete len:490 (-),score=86.25 gnl/MRDRNA2_/MRDRNA2_94743_c1_seq1:144-1613(-)